jgi:hypothetical protein
MNRSPEEISYVMHRDMCTMYAMVQGAGAAAPVLPTTVLSLSSSIQPALPCDNFASNVAGDITRSGVGLYTIKLKEALPVILDIGVSLWGTDGKWAQMTDYNPQTRVVTVKVYAAGGAAADLAATDNLKLSVVGRLTTTA